MTTDGSNITAPISYSDIYAEVADIVQPHGWTVGRFVWTDIDDVPDEWRDLYLMTADVLRGDTFPCHNCGVRAHWSEFAGGWAHPVSDDHDVVMPNGKRAVVWL